MDYATIVKIVTDNKEISDMNGMTLLINKLIDMNAITFLQPFDKEINKCNASSQLHLTESSVIVTINGLYGISLKMTVSRSGKVVEDFSKVEITGEVRYKYSLWVSTKTTDFLRHPKFGCVVNSYARLLDVGAVDKFVGGDTALLFFALADNYNLAIKNPGSNKIKRPTKGSVKLIGQAPVKPVKFDIAHAINDIQFDDILQKIMKEDALYHNGMLIVANPKPKIFEIKDEEEDDEKPLLDNRKK